MVNVIIFSKDRACQLDLLIRSLQKHWKISANFNILYTYSMEEFKRGYDKLRGTCNSGNFYLEKYFKRDLAKLLQSDCKYTMFLTDDIVFTKDFTIDPVFNKFRKRLVAKNDVGCFSLRLGKNIAYSYPLDKKIKVPMTTKFIYTWKWRKHEGDWGYPMSVDGHVFLTKDMMPLCESVKFYNPNSLEAALANNPTNKPFMMCYKEPRLINLAINRVQDTFPNRAGNVDPRYLNNRYLNDGKIALELIEIFANTVNSCHVECEPVFIRAQ